MYSTVLGTASTLAGTSVIAKLPNTGAHTAAEVLAILSIISGVAILASTALRFLAKRG